MLIAEHRSDTLVALRSFAAGLSERNISVLHQDSNMVYDLVENLPRQWPVQDLAGHTDDAGEVLGEWARNWLDAKREVLATGRPRSIEILIPLDAGRQIFEARMQPDLDGSGQPRGVITVLADVTDLRERELALFSLMREVSHRSKNLLAIVQSIAAQTAHHSESMAEFLAKFRGRLQALASIQDLVTDSDWRGTQFRALVSAQLDRSGDGSADRVKVSGDNPMLGPNAALHIGLALHELLSNARRFGALSRQRQGTISISSQLQMGGNKMTELIVEWLELSRGEPLSPLVPRFGTMVLERIVPLSVGGSAEHELGDDGLHYKLRVPAGNFEF